MSAVEVDPAAIGDCSHASLLERARVIAGKARLRAEETDRARQLSDEIVGEMWGAGLMRVRQPRRWGGLERSALEFYEIISALAEGDCSTGWVYAVLAGHSSMVPDFAEAAQAEVWGADPRLLVSSALAPTGRAEPIAGGVKLSGRFPFSSGCDHAQWAILGAFAPTPEGRPLPHLFLVPRTEISVIDDWSTMGLRGTGSKTLAADGVFVPAHRAIVMPVFSVELFGIQSAIIGAATGALKAFVDETKGKPGRMGLPPPAQSDHYQTLVGQSAADLKAARTVLADAVSTSERLTRASPSLPQEQIIHNRGAVSVITRLTTQAVERIYELSGGHGVYDSVVSRALRDVRSGCQHIGTNAHWAGREIGASLLT